MNKSPLQSRLSRSEGKVPKDSPLAVYMGPDKGPFHCGGCEYFIEPNACHKVAGKIDPGGCCNFYEKSDD